MLDINYACSLICVKVKYTIHSQELLSKVFLQHLKYGQICKLEVLIWDSYFGIFHTGAVKIAT